MVLEKVGVKSKKYGKIELTASEDGLQLRYKDLPGPMELSHRHFDDLRKIMGKSKIDEKIRGRSLETLAYHMEKVRAGQTVYSVSPEHPGISLYHQEKEICDFVQENGKGLEEGVCDLIGGNKVVLIGEYHGEKGDYVRKHITRSLQIFKNRGLTHLGVEMESKNQGALEQLDPYSGNIMQDLRRIAPPAFNDTSLNMIVEAKKAGLEVVCLNKKADGDLTFDKHAQDGRDEHMHEIAKQRLDGNSKMLILIGAQHVGKRDLETTQGLRAPLAKRLADSFGQDGVCSICSVSKNTHLDGQHKLRSKTPSFEQILKDGAEPVILPEKYPIQRPSNRPKADYLMVV